MQRLVSSSRLLNKVSPVAIRDSLSVSDLSYAPRWGRSKFVYELAKKYDTITEQNRYASLEIILQRLSGYAGRRQYKMQNDLKPLAEKLKAEKIDWHDLKSLSQGELYEVIRRLGLTPAEKAVLLSAVEIRACGVLTRGKTHRDPQLVCMRPGDPKHGWRCGKEGHRDHIYFEHKPRASEAVVLSRRETIQRRLEYGAEVEVLSRPDFSIEGRMQHETHPRVWSAPTDPLFDVSVIGFEFRIHPQDPRAGPQVRDVADQWKAHGDVVSNVLWEMLENYGVVRAAQPLEFVPNELQPDGYEKQLPLLLSAPPVEAGDDALPVDRRMAGDDPSFPDLPWMITPPPQPFSSEGIPEFLPYPPTMVIQSRLRSMDGLSAEEQASRLRNPLMDITCLIHPKACLWFSPEDEEKALEHVLSFAKRMPFALPFNLYLRVDPRKALLDDEFKAARDGLTDTKRSFFDLSHFGTVPSSAAGDDDGTTMEVNPDGWE